MTDDAVSGARSAARPTTQLIGSTAEKGVDSVESNTDEVWGALAVLDQVRRGEQLGVDGYVIACFGDTGIAGAREAASGPVVGMTEASLFTAALVAPRFTIVTLPPRTREQSTPRAAGDRLGAPSTVRAIDAPVSEAAADSAALLDAIAEQAIRAVHEDGAEAIVLGCAGLSAIAGAARRPARSAGHRRRLCRRADGRGSHRAEPDDIAHQHLRRTAAPGAAAPMTVLFH